MQVEFNCNFKLGVTQLGLLQNKKGIQKKRLFENALYYKRECCKMPSMAF